MLNLSGAWSFALDGNDLGVDECWFKKTLQETIYLPGSTDEGGFGEVVEEVDLHRFNRVHRFIGAAWYQKEILIPEGEGRRLVLFLERCMWETRVWVDDQYAGEGESLCCPHEFDLTKWLTPGKHRISIRVDNSPKYHLGIRGHAYSEDMQTIWNGITGRIELRAFGALSIGAVRVDPDVAACLARVRVTVINTGSESPVRICLQATLRGSEIAIPPVECEVIAPHGESLHDTVLPMGSDVCLWEEWAPHLYELAVRLESAALEKRASEMTVVFGMREFRADGPVFRWNGRQVLLRGTHDGGCFPLTGYPSCDVKDWRRIYRILKSYGMNHIRFHSYCPPEAAFIGADEEGVVIQAELPLFSISAPDIGADEARDAFLHREFLRMLDVYGNHPSFCLMAMGNELRGDYGILSKWVQEGQAADKRHLYCTSSNNGPEPSLMQRRVGSEDFLVSPAKVNGEELILRRGEQVFSKLPETDGDYRESLEGMPVPVISHEVGQWQTYPDFSEIPRYTGVLRARSLEVFRDSLEKNGLLHLADRFVQASGRLSMALYREEIERSLRTPNYGGFQLLDVRDYHGQGTSTIGWLNTFWDSKGLIEPEEFRRFCGPLVLLLRMERRVWCTDQLFKAKAQISNYTGHAIENVECGWSLRAPDGSVVAAGKLPSTKAMDGTLSSLGEWSLDLSFVTKAGKYQVELQAADLFNSWDLWIYPAQLQIQRPENCLIAGAWDASVEEALQEGRDVLLISENANRSEAARFTPVFWNTLLFSGQEKFLGILCDPSHPMLESFPTDFHANWQWWDLLSGSRAIDLSTLPMELDPIVRFIDHPVRNHSMSLVFEAHVGKGRLLCVSANLSEGTAVNPVRRQFKAALLQYMGSQDFHPSCDVSIEGLRDVLKPAVKNWLAVNYAKIEADSCWWDGPVENLVDGERVTMWKSARDVPFPHEIKVELQSALVVWGFRYSPRQDGLEAGMVREYAFYVSLDGINWGEPVAKGSFPKGGQDQTIFMNLFDDGFNRTRSKAGRFIRCVLLSSHDGGDLAAFSGIDVLPEPPAHAS